MSSSNRICPVELLLVSALTILLASCSAAPRIPFMQNNTHGAQTQKVLSSARNWDTIAADVACGVVKGNSQEKTGSANCAGLEGRSKDSIDTSSNSSPKSANTVDGDGKGEVVQVLGKEGKYHQRYKPCVAISRNVSDSVFQKFFADALVRELLHLDVMVVSGDGFYRDCERIDITSTFVRLDATKEAQYYPGEYSELAEGIVVVRNLARAFSEVRFVGLTALGETAYYFSPAYLASHNVGELAVTVSRINGNNEYLAQYTNVYYVSANDSNFYTPVVRTEDDRQSREYGYYRNEPSPPAHPQDPRQSAEAWALSVFPNEISTCDNSVTFALFWVNGAYYFNTDLDSYSFGTIRPTPISYSKLQLQEKDSRFKFFEVKFDALTKSNQGVNPVYLNIMTPYGFVSKPIDIVSGCNSDKENNTKVTKPKTSKQTPKPDPNKVAAAPSSTNAATVAASISASFRWGPTTTPPPAAVLPEKTKPGATTSTTSTSAPAPASASASSAPASANTAHSH